MEANKIRDARSRSRMEYPRALSFAPNSDYVYLPRDRRIIAAGIRQNKKTKKKEEEEKHTRTRARAYIGENVGK